MGTAKGPGSMATSRQKTVGHPAAGGKLWWHQSLNSRRHSADGGWTLAVHVKNYFLGWLAAVFIRISATTGIGW
jgi:hypothetical protein